MLNITALLRNSCTSATLSAGASAWFGFDQISDGACALKNINTIGLEEITTQKYLTRTPSALPRNRFCNFSPGCPSHHCNQTETNEKIYSFAIRHRLCLWWFNRANS
jgi:hypothetical protein